jgi:hypothetical protein
MLASRFMTALITTAPPSQRLMMARSRP